ACAAYAWNAGTATATRARDAIPERVRDLYDETESGWVFALDIPGNEVPDLLVHRIEARADVLGSEREAEIRTLSATSETLRAEAESLRAELDRGKVAGVVRDAARAEGVMLDAYPDVEAAAIADAARRRARPAIDAVRPE
ncbi:MAG: hypothetical protein ACRD2A_09545, partial [Vicinamibacterales bacterium]